MRRSILVVTPRYPYPVVGGDRLRIFHICQELAKRFDLTLLSLCETEEELNAAAPADGVFQRVERVLLPRWRSVLQCAVALPSDTPLQVAYYRCARFRERIADLAAQHDGVLAHLIRAGDMVKSVPVPRFLEMTDAISLNYQRLRDGPAQRLSLRSWVYQLELKRLKHYEQRVVDRFDHCFLVSEADREFLFGGTGREPRVSVVTNGVDLVRSPFQFAQEGCDLVFIGNMLTLPNLDAVHYAATEILPRVRAVFAQSALRVIGRVGARERAVLERLEGVHVVGEVQSVARAAEGAGAGICPMRLGAGVQNKLLEYMALGLPAVTSTIGLEGLAAAPGVALEVADDAEGFARHLIALLSDRERARAVAVAARQHVQDHHSWEAVLAPMVDVIDQRLNG